MTHDARASDLKGQVRKDAKNLVSNPVQYFFQDNAGLQADGETDTEVHYHVWLSWSNSDGVDTYQFCAAVHPIWKIVGIDECRGPIRTEISLFGDNRRDFVMHGKQLNLSVLIEVVEVLENGEMLWIPAVRLVPLNQCHAWLINSWQQPSGITLEGRWKFVDGKLDATGGLVGERQTGCSVLNEMPRNMVERTAKAEEDVPDSKAPIARQLVELVDSGFEGAGEHRPGVHARRVSVRLEMLRHAPWWGTIQLVNPITNISLKGFEVLVRPIELIPPATDRIASHDNLDGFANQATALSPDSMPSS